MEDQGNSDLDQIYDYVTKRLKDEGFAKIEDGKKELDDFIDDADKEVIMNLF